jgi:hypothetical protein
LTVILTLSNFSCLEIGNMLLLLLLWWVLAGCLIRLQTHKDNHSMDAMWLMSDCSLRNNTVYHALLTSVGNRTTWRQFLNQHAVFLRSQPLVEGEQSITMAVVEALTLDSAASGWWMVGCNVTDNQLLRPAALRQAAAAAPAAPPAAAAADGRGGDGSIPDFDSVTSPDSMSDWSMPAANKNDLTPQHLSAESYSELLGEILSADREVLDALSVDLAVCAASLQALLTAEKHGVPGRPLLRLRSPAVLWAMFSQGFVADTRVERNIDFDHVLRIDNSYVVFKQFDMSYNNARNSVFDLWYSDLWMTKVVVLGNKVEVGSVLDFESFRGTFDQVGACRIEQTI